jgi:hypothetical protein
VVPRVQVLLATPSAFVGPEGGLMAPPAAVIAQATVTPGAGCPSSVTTTWSGFASGWATVPVCALPLVEVMETVVTMFPGGGSLPPPPPQPSTTATEKTQSGASVAELSLLINPTGRCNVPMTVYSYCVSPDMSCKILAQIGALDRSRAIIFQISPGPASALCF